MDTTTLPHALMRVYADGTTEPVSEHPDFTSGWEARTHATHAEPEYAFSLYADGQRVARFAHARLSPRLSVTGLDALVLG